MLFTRISLAALLLFVATVSSAPLHEPTAGVATHADHAGKGLPPALSHGSRQHAPAGLAAAQGAPRAPAPAHAASHVHVHATPDASLEGPADAPTELHARSPTLLAVANAVHLHAADAHHDAAVAHNDAARQYYQQVSHHLQTGHVDALAHASGRVAHHNSMALEHAHKEAEHRARAASLAHPNAAALHTAEQLHEHIGAGVESYQAARHSATTVRSYTI
ncbi:hypothetical protein HYPSUDRAFT_206376 [Hypholoma sublateritium FD-334 SS-4]|uniref:DUF1771 domain-containing protein n=1 Tax=Hypholoma sublateritium (strain FD-334 SS-4) TaxID=945553 RepID=A0A0D2NKX7_HYPSF|nr:hypothetical protein HYPSUDRAFT_206376 [Hypholoma sublateritium FD-334 SS-4]